MARTLDEILKMQIGGLVIELARVMAEKEEAVELLASLQSGQISDGKKAEEIKGE